MDAEMDDKQAAPLGDHSTAAELRLLREDLASRQSLQDGHGRRVLGWTIAYNLLTLLAVAASFVGVWIAQKNFNTDQRPIMWIGNVDRPSYNSGGVDWNFDLVNAGKSPARNVRYDLVIGVDSGTDQHQPRENWKYIAIVMPGMPNERDGSQPARVTAHTPGEPYTTERFAQAARTPGSIKVGGIVEYEGIGGHYRTTFCFANDVSNPAGALHYQYVTQAECTNDVQ